jgi:hypothetical protein
MLCMGRTFTGARTYYFIIALNMWFVSWESTPARVNRIPVMAPISAPILGSVFFWGIFPSKMGRFAPFLATIQALSKTRVFLYT